MAEKRGELYPCVIEDFVGVELSSGGKTMDDVVVDDLFGNASERDAHESCSHLAY